MFFELIYILTWKRLLLFGAWKKNVGFDFEEVKM